MGLAHLFDLDPQVVGCELDVDMPGDLRKVIDECWQARAQYETAYRELLDTHRHARQVLGEHFGAGVTWMLLPPGVYEPMSTALPVTSH